MSRLPLLRPFLFALLFLLSASIAVAACGDDDGGDSPADTTTPLATATPTPDRVPDPAATISTIRPPFENIGRESGAEIKNYREDPAFALPDPADLESLPEDLSELQPVPESCPDDWMILTRPGQGFTICFPSDWALDGQGYVTGGADDRWHAAGIFKREGSQELAHVSIYGLPPGAKPFLYVRDCEEDVYAIELEDFPATVCPSSSAAQGDEAEIIAYHVRFEDLELFVNVVIKEGASDDIRDIALQIVRSIDVKAPTPLTG